MDGFDNDAAIAIAKELNDRKILLLDYGESMAEILVGVDEDMTWPTVPEEIRQLSPWKIPRILTKLSPEHQLDVARDWLILARDTGRELNNLVNSILKIPARSSELSP